MATPAKPWWHLFLDGRASADVPPFFGAAGIAAESWDADTGLVRLSFEPPAWSRTSGGWVQGGFLGVALDAAHTLALFSQLPEGRTPRTLELNVSFIGAPFEQRYVVTARPLRIGRTAAHTEGTVELGGGTLIATSRATHVIAERAT